MLNLPTNLLQHISCCIYVYIFFLTREDKKRYEASRCREFNSIKGCIGVLLMLVMDCIQLWLSVSVIMSWMMTSRYFFPTPNIPINAGLLTNSSTSSLNKYGVNIGPMVISFLFQLVKGKIESWTGNALSSAYTLKKKARKAAKKEKAQIEARKAKQQRKEERATRRMEREVRKQAGVVPNSVKEMHQGTTTVESDGMNDLD